MAYGLWEDFVWDAFDTQEAQYLQYLRTVEKSYVGNVLTT